MKRISIALLSGGKDSTLTAIKCIEKRGGECEIVFLDTGWEHIETYKHIALLNRLFIDRWGVSITHLKSVTMKDLVLEKKFFPNYFRRYCTHFLKLRPFYNWLLNRHEKEGFNLVEIWTGVRKEESERRKNRKQIEVFKKGVKIKKDIPKLPFHTIYVYPILEYAEEEVFEELERLNIPVNPLYRKGHKRVGCYPCLASERSIRDTIRDALSGDKFAQERVEEIKKMEGILGRKVKRKSIDELIKKEWLLSRQKSLFSL